MGSATSAAFRRGLLCSINIHATNTWHATTCDVCMHSRHIKHNSKTNNVKQMPYQMSTVIIFYPKPESFLFLIGIRIITQLIPVFTVNTSTIHITQVSGTINMVSYLNYSVLGRLHLTGVCSILHSQKVSSQYLISRATG